ncbi:hypothetical protein FMN50_01425 [Rhodobacterales bacterium]|nr:hypothetical protein FMN50_01425 [Rhodobacterales bacterium]
MFDGVYQPPVVGKQTVATLRKDFLFLLQPPDSSIRKLFTFCASITIEYDTELPIRARIVQQGLRNLDFQDFYFRSFFDPDLELA